MGGKTDPFSVYRRRKPGSNGASKATEAKAEEKVALRTPMRKLEKC